MSNKMLNNPEFAEIIEESEKELKVDIDKMFLDIIGSYRKEIRNLKNFNYIKQKTILYFN